MEKLVIYKSDIYDAQYAKLKINDNIDFIDDSYKHCVMLSQLFEMENVFTVSSDPHPPPAAPPSLSLPLSSSSTSSGTKKQKRTPTYQRSVSQGSSHPSFFSLC